MTFDLSYSHPSRRVPFGGAIGNAAAGGFQRIGELLTNQKPAVLRLPARCQLLTSCIPEAGLEPDIATAAALPKTRSSED